MRTDGFSKAGALELAAKVRAFWKSRGEEVSVWIEELDKLPAKVGATQKDPMFGVRSNLFNGLPLKRAALAA